MRYSLIVTIYIGFDLSSKKIAAVGYNDRSDQAQLWMETINSKSHTFHSGVLDVAYHASLKIAKEFRELGNSHDDSVVYVESPIHGKGHKTTITLAKVSGVVQLALVQMGFEPLEVNVSTWKKIVCGSGRATKEEVDRKISAQWGGVYKKTGGEQDVVDASAVCLYGVIQRSRKSVLEA